MLVLRLFDDLVVGVIFSFLGGLGVSRILIFTVVGRRKLGLYGENFDLQDFSSIVNGRNSRVRQKSNPVNQIFHYSGLACDGQLSWKLKS